MVKRLGIVGYGWVARDYMRPAIERHPDAQLRAVVSVREADFIGLPPWVQTFLSLEAMLRRAQLDAVYVASPNHLHRAHTVACLGAELDVLCEKPLATTQSDATAMIDAAKNSQRTYVTAYDQRHHPAHREMHRWVAEGRLGKITQARIDYACWLPADWCSDNWRIDPEKAGGGAIIDLAPHGLDLLETLIGDRITALHCFDQSAVQGYGVDDGGVLSARFAGGTLATLTVAYNRPEKLPRRRLELIGTQGMLIAENTMGQEAGGQLLYVDAASGESRQLPFEKSISPFDLQLDAFLRACQGEPTSARTPQDDLRLYRLLNTALHQNHLQCH